MDMSFETAILLFVGNGIVFIILSIIITKMIAKLTIRDTIEYLGLKKNENFRKNIVLGFIFAVLMPIIQLLAMSIVGVIVSKILDINLIDILKGYYGTIANSPVGQVGLYGKLGFALCMIVFVGLGEEIFFRGMIQKGMVSKFGKYIGILITAIIFTLMHGFYMLDLPIAIASASALFVVSLVFGIIKEKTDSLIPSIIAHGFGNAIIYTITAQLIYDSLS